MCKVGRVIFNAVFNLEYIQGFKNQARVCDLEPNQPTILTRGSASYI